MIPSRGRLALLGAALATLLAAAGGSVPVHASIGIPRSGTATEVGFVYVDGIKGSSLIEITCDPHEPSSGHMVGSVVAGHASLNYWVPGLDVDAEDGIWIGGEDAGDASYSRSFRTRDRKWYWTGITDSVVGPSGQAWDHLLAVATIGGPLGECSATSKGEPIPFIKAGRSGWEDLGGTENPLWIRQGNTEAGTGRIVELPLLGGTLIAQTWHDQGSVLALMQGSVPWIQACTPARGPICTFSNRTATKITAGLAAGLSSHAGTDGYASPTLLYFDLPPEAGPDPCLVGLRDSCLVDPID